MLPRHVLFVRHGESRHHVDGLSGGWTDTPLTDRGAEQIGATARWLELPLQLPVAFSFAPASISELSVNRWNERSIERLNVLP